MRLEQAIAIMEDPEKHEIIFEHAELTGWLKELRDARDIIKRQAQYIEAYIDYIDCEH